MGSGDESLEVDDKIVRHNGAKDRYVLLSGGMDSVAMTHYLIEEKWSDRYNSWNKRPNVVYIDTTIGLSSQRIYVELLSDKYNWSLITVRTHENYEEHTKEEGFYSNQTHDKIFNRLKGRPLARLKSASGNPHFYFGSRRDESPNRSNIPKVKYANGAWNHNPIYDWSDRDVAVYLKENEIPFNPNWDTSHFTDCGCGATANREELIELEAEGYEVFANKLRNLENQIEREDGRDHWAWQSFDPNKEGWLEDTKQEMEADISNLMCGKNCSSKSKIAKAFESGEIEVKESGKDIKANKKVKCECGFEGKESKVIEHSIQENHDIEVK